MRRACTSVSRIFAIIGGWKCIVLNRHLLNLGYFKYKWLVETVAFSLLMQNLLDGQDTVDVLEHEIVECGVIRRSVITRISTHAQNNTCIEKFLKRNLKAIRRAKLINGLLSGRPTSLTAKDSWKSNFLHRQMICEWSDDFIFIPSMFGFFPAFFPYLSTFIQFISVITSCLICNFVVFAPADSIYIQPVPQGSLVVGRASTCTSKSDDFANGAGSCATSRLFTSSCMVVLHGTDINLGCSNFLQQRILYVSFRIHSILCSFMQISLMS